MVTNQASNLKELLAKDEKYLSSALYRVFHIVAEKGEGPYIYSTDGVKYLDLTCGIGVTQLGHCHEEVIKAAQEQLTKLVHISCVTHHTENIKLAEKLASILPGNLNNTFFCNSGSEAVDGAIKFARRLNPGRPNLIAFKGSFHGRTIGGTSLSSSKEVHRKFYDPLLPGVNFVEFPNCYTGKYKEHSAERVLETLEQMFKSYLSPDSISAMIIEAMQGEGGYLPAPLKPINFLKELRNICDKHKILLICDEVQSGIGRTGKWFSINHYDVVPDVITIAKGLGNGLPIGGFCASHERMSTMPPASHGSTFGGNPVSCAAAYKTLEVIERDNLLDYVFKTGSEIIDHLAKELSTQANVRGFGFMIGIELESKEKVEKVKDECFKENILILPTGEKAIRLLPPLNIEKALLTNSIDKLINIIKKV
ncbi:MAG: aminotransferase class III-fold pyridoxal phosphate-dependent enzyme [Candidatus Melainabacteria bacterium]|nr:aminotransferase class III-fold pyridoxal phosphate-dependent enzyme [Candidatus Melainabacteria bacterium]